MFVFVGWAYPWFVVGIRWVWYFIERGISDSWWFWLGIAYWLENNPLQIVLRGWIKSVESLFWIWILILKLNIYLYKISLTFWSIGTAMLINYLHSISFHQMILFILYWENIWKYIWRYNLLISPILNFGIWYVFGIFWFWLFHLYTPIFTPILLTLLLAKPITVIFTFILLGLFAFYIIIWVHK